MKIRTDLRRLPDGPAGSWKRRATGILGIVCGVLTLGQASLVMADPPLPTVPGGYEVRVVKAGGEFAGKHIAGITVDPVSGNIYVATDIGGQFDLEPTFDLWRITPSGVVSFVGNFNSSVSLTVDLTWGPDGKIYVVKLHDDTVHDDRGVVYATDPVTGIASLFSPTGLTGGLLFRFALEFDAGVDRI